MSVLFVCVLVCVCVFVCTYVCTYVCAHCTSCMCIRAQLVFWLAQFGGRDAAVWGGSRPLGSSAAFREWFAQFLPSAAAAKKDANANDW